MAQSSIHGRKLHATKIALDIPIALAGFEIRLRRTVGYVSASRKSRLTHRKRIILEVASPHFLSSVADLK